MIMQNSSQIVISKIRVTMDRNTKLCITLVVCFLIISFAMGGFFVYNWLSGRAAKVEIEAKTILIFATFFKIFGFVNLKIKAGLNIIGEVGGVWKKLMTPP